jgi:hypothetical protein
MRTPEFLKDVRVATPCRADWNAMEGDDKKRFCLSCKKHVHNFSAMTETEIMDLYRQQGGDLCIRFYVRKDGTMIVGDCPVGVRRRKRNLVLAVAVGMVAVFLVGTTAARAAYRNDQTLLEILESNRVTARILDLLGLSRPVVQGLSGSVPIPLPQSSKSVPTSGEVHT